MNMKIIYSITLGIAVSVASVFAEEDTAALRADVDALNKRLDELESKPAPEAKSGWESKVKLKGDLRYRFQHVEAEDTSGANRIVRSHS